MASHKSWACVKSIGHKLGLSQAMLNVSHNTTATAPCIHPATSNERVFIVIPVIMSTNARHVNTAIPATSAVPHIFSCHHHALMRLTSVRVTTLAILCCFSAIPCGHRVCCECISAVMEFE